MDYGGIETWLMQVLRRIDRTKFQLDFCYTGSKPGAYAPEIESLGGRMVACPLNRKDPIGFARRFRSLLRGAQYDIVHSHAHHFSGFVLRLARQEHVPVRMAHCHSTSDGKGTGLSRGLYHALMRHWIWRHGTHGLAASEDAAQALFGPNWRSDSRFRVLHCGIDLEPFRQPVSRAAVRQELGIPLDAPVVGHVGSFRPAKNHPFLLEIAAEVVKHRPDVRFLLVGDGPLRPQIEARARELGIAGNVIFTGVRSDVPRLMLGAMDLFLFPSLWEGLPIVVVEAQAAGLRCLVSDTVTREVSVVPGAVEFLPLSVGAGEWSSRALQLLHYGRILSEVALGEVQRCGFNIERSADQLRTLYESALDHPVAETKRTPVPA
jgi:glycosyltransferase involved in cell wall biosynthesis